MAGLLPKGLLIHRWCKHLSKAKSRVLGTEESYEFVEYVGAIGLEERRARARRVGCEEGLSCADRTMIWGRIFFFFGFGLLCWVTPRFVLRVQWTRCGEMDGCIARAMATGSKRQPLSRGRKKNP